MYVCVCVLLNIFIKIDNILILIKSILLRLYIDEYIMRSIKKTTEYKMSL